MAALAALGDLPVNVVYARIGAFLTLLAPLAFYVMTARLFDRVTGVAAVVCFLFLTGGIYPDWCNATYSPLPFTNLIVQTLLYVSIATFAHFLQTSARTTLVLSGALLGVIFLGHAGPASVFALLVTITWLARLAGRGPPTAGFASPGRATRQYLLLVVLALLGASPLLGPLLLEYGLQTQNAGPGSWMGGPFHVVRWRDMLAHESVPVWSVAGVGLLACLRNSWQQLGSFVVLAWTLAESLWFAYSCLVVVCAKVWQIALPGIVPAFHYYFSLTAAKALLFGVGGSVLARWVVQRAVQRAPRARDVAASLLIAGASLLVVMLKYPRYPLREAYRERLDRGLSPERLHALAWIRANTHRSAVFLADDNAALFTVAGAGRKSVAIDRFFANPYVSYAARSRDRDAMFSALDGDQPAEFAALARYSVDYALVEGGRLQRWLLSPRPCWSRCTARTASRSSPYPSDQRACFTCRAPACSATPPRPLAAATPRTAPPAR